MVGYTEYQCQCRNVDQGHNYVSTTIDLSKLFRASILEPANISTLNRQVHRQRPRRAPMLSQSLDQALEVGNSWTARVME